MKTKHQFNAGDTLKYHDRVGRVVARDGNKVTVEWADGERQSGLHHLLWMCEIVECAGAVR